MSITYKKIGKYLLPNLIAPEEQVDMGKYSMMRLDYLKTQKTGTYQAMMMKGTLIPHLKEIDHKRGYYQ